MQNEKGASPDNGGKGSPRQGLVVVRHGFTLAVEDEHGQVYHCRSRRDIGQPVCGDRVVWQLTDPGQGIVTAIKARQVALSRRDGRGREKPLAANLTQLLVLLAPEPIPNPYLLDQYLAAAELMGIAAAIVFNKIDLLDTEELARFRDELSRYEDIGYVCILTSLKDGRGLPFLSKKLGGEISILVGQSGVGKSSLVKSLLPDRDVQIGRLSQATGLGRHTTSATTCYRLPCGGRLIDSPGVRSIRLGKMAPAQLQLGFRELAPLAGRCRFGNCRHDAEPDCAVKQAIENGEIDPRRLASFRHLAAQQAN